MILFAFIDTKTNPYFILNRAITNKLKKTLQFYRNRFIVKIQFSKYYKNDPFKNVIDDILLIHFTILARSFGTSIKRLKKRKFLNEPFMMVDQKKQMILNQI